ncbi:MAG: energy transducer TonB [Deltaproteobacteria bacterium]|nr:MAG: energy transducer TonB [Deltaproteobacteria bacterium]
MKRPPRQEHIFPIALLAAISVHLLLFWGLPERLQPPAPGANLPIRVGLKRIAPPPAAPEERTKPVDDQGLPHPTAPPAPPHNEPQIPKRPATEPAAPAQKAVEPPTAEKAPVPAEKTELPVETDPAPMETAQPPSLPAPEAVGGETSPPQTAAEPSDTSIAEKARLVESATLETSSPPSLLHQPTPYYPPLAKRMGWQGKVLLRLSVKPDGRVGGVEVEKTSGYPLLDRSARKQVRTWRFEPARRNGVPVSGEVLLPVVFELRKG